MKTNQLISAALGLAVFGFLTSHTHAAFADAAPPPPVSPDKTASASAPAVDVDAPKTGLAIRVEVPVVINGGSISSGLDAMGPGVGIGGALGYYVSPHIGLFAGAQASFGHSWSGCAGSTGCGGYTFQVPVYLELAQNRARGFYGIAGLALLSTQGVTDAAGESLAVSSPFDLKLGLGYRVPQRDFFGGNSASKVAFSVFANADVGEFQSASYQDGNGNSTDGSIANKTLHYTMQVGLGGSFFL